MKSRIKISILVSIFLFGNTILKAQNQKKSLEECIDFALNNNLSLKSGVISIQRSKDMQGTAFDLSKTNLGLSQDPTSGGSPDNSISVSQDFEFPTVYFAQKKLLKAETQLERSNFDVSRHQLVKQITSTYYSLIYARENIKILHEQDSIYQKFLFLASTKFKLGETSRLEEMNAERLYNENKMELDKAQITYCNIQLELQQWLNTEDKIEPREDILSTIEPKFSIVDFSPEQTLVGKYYSDRINVNQESISVANKGLLPNFSITLKNQMLIKGFNPYNIDRERFDKGNFMGFEVGVGIPLFYGAQKAKIKVAKSDLEISKLQQQETLMNIRKEYQTSMNDYLKAKSSVEYFEQKGYKQALEIARVSQISYEKGEIDYIEYIQNLKTSVEVFLLYATAINDYNQIVITLNYLNGNKIEL